MSFTTNSNSNERRAITECEPSTWSIYRVSDSLYINAKPTHCWKDANGMEFIECVVYSKSHGEVIYVAKWNGIWMNGKLSVKLVINKQYETN